MKELRVVNDEALAQAKRDNKEFEGFKVALEEGHRAIEHERKGMEEAQKLMELESEGREEVAKNLKDLQVQLDIKKGELSAAFHQHEATKNQVSELEKETKDLKDSIPVIEA